MNIFKYIKKYRYKYVKRKSDKNEWKKNTHIGKKINPFSVLKNSSEKLIHKSKKTATNYRNDSVVPIPSTILAV